jgi:hypothetical protein
LRTHIYTSGIFYVPLKTDSVFFLKVAIQRPLDVPFVPAGHKQMQVIELPPNQCLKRVHQLCALRTLIEGVKKSCIACCVTSRSACSDGFRCSFSQDENNASTPLRRSAGGTGIATSAASTLDSVFVYRRSRSRGRQSPYECHHNSAAADAR